LLPPSPALIGELRSLLPFGLLRFAKPRADAEFGVVMPQDLAEVKH
jgi:hypothetical protein